MNLQTKILAGTDRNLPLESVFLTFDDGPDPVATKILNQRLREFDFAATFFVDYRNCLQSPSVLEELSKNGHAIGVHCVDHVDHRDISTDKLLSDFEQFIELIFSETGVRPIFTRPPYGLSNEDLMLKLWSELGLTTVLWTFDTNDWRLERSIDEVLTDAGTRLQVGDIALLHDGVADAPDPATRQAWRNRRSELAQRIDLLFGMLLDRGLRSAALEERNDSACMKQGVGSI